jgi:hypothetical protein
LLVKVENISEREAIQDYFFSKPVSYQFAAKIKNASMPNRLVLNISQKLSSVNFGFFMK